MSIAVICNHKNPKPWAEAIQRHLPDEKVEVFPHISNFEEVDFLVVWKATTEEFQQFPNIKVIQSLGASVDHILNSFEVPNDVLISRIVDFSLSHDMWEFVLAIILGEMKLFTKYDHDQHRKIWQPQNYKRIEDITLSILGAGEIGMHMAKQFSKMGFAVNTWSASPKSEVAGIKSYYGKDQLPSFLPDTDFLINILPYTPHTEGIIDYPLLSLLKSDSYFINVGRGESIVEKDLLRVLSEGAMRGAFLDVFQTEPLPENHPFWTNQKIKITPHIASITNVKTATLQIIDNYKRLQKGDKLLHLVSKSKAY